MISNYVIKSWPNGLYSLTLNLKERWPEFHIRDEYTFEVNGSIFSVSTFLPPGRFTRSVNIEKDQIIVFYHPIEKEMLKSIKVLDIKIF